MANSVIGQSSKIMPNVNKKKVNHLFAKTLSFFGFIKTINANRKQLAKSNRKIPPSNFMFLFFAKVYKNLFQN